MSGASSPTGLQTFGQGQNLIPGHTVVAHPQFLATLAGGQRWKCSMVVRFSRPREQVGPNFVDIGASASFSVIGALSGNPVQQRGGQSRLLLPATPSTLLQDQWRTPSASLPVTVVAETELTACTAASGSRDATTAGAELCASVYDHDHASVGQVQFDASQQPLTPGATCPSVRAPLTVSIDPITHHLVVSFTRRLTMSTSSTCSRVLRASLTVTGQSGPPVMFNAPQSVLFIVPGGSSSGD